MLIDLFWFTKVPGSRAPEMTFVGMVQAKANLGYDLTEAEKLLPEGLALHKAGKADDLRALTAELMSAILEAPLDMGSDYHQFDHPQDWAAIRAAMDDSPVVESLALDENTLSDRIYQGWLASLLARLSKVI